AVAAGVGADGVAARRRPDPHAARVAPVRTTTLRGVGAVGLLGVGIVHALWASGSTWPASSAEALGEAVVGSSTGMPAPGAAWVVAVGAVGAAGVVAGGGADRPVAVAVRRTVGAGILTRGVLGGVVACRILGLPSPGPRFRSLDRAAYRPVCLVLGAAILGSARRP
ncbi:MAG: DUF3995 domain-containing protein, partial [Nocardioides sp.]